VIFCVCARRSEISCFKIVTLGQRANGRVVSETCPGACLLVYLDGLEAIRGF
jgi:hypothetical protein